MQRVGGFGPASQVKRALGSCTPARHVLAPVDDGAHGRDGLAIAEHPAERSSRHRFEEPCAPGR